MNYTDIAIVLSAVALILVCPINWLLIKRYCTIGVCGKEDDWKNKNVKIICYANLALSYSLMVISFILFAMD